MRSLGWLAVAWIEHFCRHGPGDVQGQPVVHGDEYTGFIVDCYALDENGRRLYDSGFLSRSKGTDKSGQGARFGLFEALGPCRFAGFARGGEVYEDPWGLGFRYVYEQGEPMGRPVNVPFVRIMATEETQTSNVFDSIYFNLTDEGCPLAHVPGLDVGLGRVRLPDGGEITPSTSGAASKDGGKETWVSFDESHLMTTPELRRMYATVTRNLRKRKQTAETWYLETTTMYAAGENSVAERTFAEAQALAEGRKRGRHRLLYDHRWGECDDLSNEAALRAAIVDAYGDAMAFNDLDGIVDEFHDTRTDPTDSRRFFLNTATSAADAWLTAPQWDGCGRPDLDLADGDLVCLGLDGSISHDATALVACRVPDGHLELLGVWEAPEGPDGDNWQVDRIAVDAALAQAMERFDVAGFFCDPAHWQDSVARWAAEWGERMRVKATATHPLNWWTNRPKPMVAALERFHEAVLERRLSFTPAADRVGEAAQRALTLRRHTLNARRRPSRAGLQIGKPYPKSPHRIDSVMAAVLAFEARGQALAQGVKPRVATRPYRAKRIR